jgi:hypothetical protein
MNEQKPSVSVVVSPDIAPQETQLLTLEQTPTKPMLVPMPEWKQAAQRGIRSAIQAFLFILPLGVTAYMKNLGIPDSAMMGLPSTSVPLFDAILYSIAFGLVVFAWNWVEFYFDMDIRAPKWRV